MCTRQQCISWSYSVFAVTAPLCNQVTQNLQSWYNNLTVLYRNAKATCTWTTIQGLQSVQTFVAQNMGTNVTPSFRVHRIYSAPEEIFQKAMRVGLWGDRQASSLELLLFGTNTTPLAIEDGVFDCSEHSDWQKYNPVELHLLLPRLMFSPLLWHQSQGFESTWHTPHWRCQWGKCFEPLTSHYGSCQATESVLLLAP